MGASCFDMEDGTTGIRIQERVRASPGLGIARSATTWRTTSCADCKIRPAHVTRVPSSDSYSEDWPTEGATRCLFPFDLI